VYNIARTIRKELGNINSMTYNLCITRYGCMALLFPYSVGHLAVKTSDRESHIQSFLYAGSLCKRVKNGSNYTSIKR
jgi:hypothetical protein